MHNEDDTSIARARGVTRREFVSATAASAGALGIGGGSLLAATAASATAAQRPTGSAALGLAQQVGDVTFSSIESETSRKEEQPPNPRPPGLRVGYAIVGLGRLALTQVLPAFAHCKHSRLVGLVSGDVAKAGTIAAQYGLDQSHVYNYQNFDRIRDDASIDAVYVILPNNMHAEYTNRAAKAGKDVLCEKPMAVSVAEAEEMVRVCRSAGRKLQIAYRIQYEPHNRAMMKLVRSRELGAVKVIEMANGQDMGTPNHWRLKQAQSGGGSLPDVGIYCLNTARFLTGEEPTSVKAIWHKTPGDARFADVNEENIIFQMQFPSGILVNATSGYGFHRSQRYRVNAEDGWAELDPAFPYTGLRMRVARAPQRMERIEERDIPQKNQFALEMDHFSTCIRENKQPYTPGEEGLQDMRIMSAIYRAAREGSTVPVVSDGKLDAYRGTAPVTDE